MAEPHIVYWTEKVSRASRLFRIAEEKNTKSMREKTVEEQRHARQMLAEVRPTPPNVTVTPVMMGPVPCEWIAREESRRDKVIVYVHGGSWTFGTQRSARPIGVMLAEYCDAPVLVVDYRLCPEHPYPAALEDCHRVYQNLLEGGFSGGDIALFGDSAGGNLVLCLIHLLKAAGEPLPAAIGCASPVTDLTLSSPIWLAKPDLIFTNWQGLEQDVLSMYTGGRDRTLPTISPLYGDLANFPPILIHVAGDEPLCADNIAFAEKAHSAGVDVTCKVWHEMFHDFTAVGFSLKESRLSLREMAETLYARLSEDRHRG